MPSCPTQIARLLYASLCNILPLSPVQDTLIMKLSLACRFPSAGHENWKRGNTCVTVLPKWAEGLDIPRPKLPVLFLWRPVEIKQPTCCENTARLEQIKSSSQSSTRSKFGAWHPRFGHAFCLATSAVTSLWCYPPKWERKCCRAPTVSEWPPRWGISPLPRAD